MSIDDVIQAFKICTSDKGECGNCPYYDPGDMTSYCQRQMSKDVLERLILLKKVHEGRKE